MMCAACDHGDHHWHDYAAEIESCDCLHPTADEILADSAVLVPAQEDK